MAHGVYRRCLSFVLSISESCNFLESKTSFHLVYCRFWWRRCSKVKQCKHSHCYRASNVLQTSLATEVAMGLLLTLCRSWRYEQELASLLWKVEMKDVAIFRTTTPQYSSSLNLSRVGVAVQRLTVSGIHKFFTSLLLQKLSFGSKINELVVACILLSVAFYTDFAVQADDRWQDRRCCT